MCVCVCVCVQAYKHVKASGKKREKHYSTDECNASTHLGSWIRICVARRRRFTAASCRGVILWGVGKGEGKERETIGCLFAEPFFLINQTTCALFPMIDAVLSFKYRLPCQQGPRPRIHVQMRRMRDQPLQ